MLNKSNGKPLLHVNIDDIIVTNLRTFFKVKLNNGQQYKVKES